MTLCHLFVIMDQSTPDTSPLICNGTNSVINNVEQVADPDPILNFWVPEPVIFVNNQVYDRELEFLCLVTESLPVWRKQKVDALTALINILQR